MNKGRLIQTCSRMSAAILLLLLLSMGVSGGFSLPQWLRGAALNLYKQETMTWHLYQMSQSSYTAKVQLCKALMGNPYYLKEDETGKNQQELTASTMAVKENKESSQEESGTGDAIESQMVLGDIQWQLQKEDTKATSQASKGNDRALVQQLKQIGTTDYLLKNFFIVDGTTSIVKQEFNVNDFLTKDFTLPKVAGAKQILIYHTHGQSEQFISENGEDSSIIALGDILTKELEKKGYGVYHDQTKYDLIHGKVDRSMAYNKALEGITKIMKENPQIQIVIDLHRDAAGNNGRDATQIKGNDCAKVMLFNGMSRNQRGEIAYLKNSNRKDNLAFSFQIKCAAMMKYNGLMRPIYLKGYRYNLHVCKRSILVELGNEKNYFREAKNSVVYLADAIEDVLTPK